MSPDFFPIEQVQREWVLESEHLGGKEKFWYRKPDEDVVWLFKYPRPNSGEHWAEKIAAEIGDLLDISCARVELAIFQGDRGSSSKSFLLQNQQLFHGNQVLARLLGNYDATKRFNQSRHTWENIYRSWELLFEEHEGALAAMNQFADLMVLDALIGNTDRHHEIWGIVSRRNSDKWVGYLAPSFDHASSLGRELNDIRREGLLANRRVSDYSARAASGIYWSEFESSAPSPIELVRRASREYPGIFGPALSKLSRPGVDNWSEIVSRIPFEWMSDSARRFAARLISYNWKQLIEIE